MNSARPRTVLLAAAILLRRTGTALPCAVALLLAAAAAWAWLSAERSRQAARFRSELAMALPAAPGTPQPRDNDGNLAGFYESLGEHRYAEQQVRTLFALAGKAGLELSEGEYRSGYDVQGRFHTYQVALPVKGSYGAVWQFAMMALASMPFAALDEISFRRNDVGAAEVEARLRLTLYLAAGEGA